MKGLRIALPLVLAIILCVIFFWPMVSEHLEKTDTQASGKKKIDLSHITDNRLVTPSYSAVDDKGNPYSVNAEWANQLDKNTIELNAPRGEITLENQEKISVTGESGLY